MTIWKFWSRDWSKNPHESVTWLESIWLCDLGAILFERIILNDLDDFNFVRFISLWSYRRSPLVVQYKCTLDQLHFLYFRTCTRSATQSMTQRGVKHLEHVSKCLEQQITSSWNDQLCEDWLSQHKPTWPIRFRF